MPIPEYAAFDALDPFFRIVEQGLSGFVDSEHQVAVRAISLSIWCFSQQLASCPTKGSAW
jgi:hypothetical protein